MVDQDWIHSKTYSAEKIALAQRILEQVNAGSEVDQAVSENPLPGGEGYMGKNVLVAAYNQLVESGIHGEECSCRGI